MNKNLMKRLLPPFCALLGMALLAATVWACIGLDLGGRKFVAASLLTLAALAAALVWLETRSLSCVMVLLLPIGAAMLIRVPCLDHLTGDYHGFLSKWYEYFKTNGGFSAIAESVGDYNVPYLYFIAAISYLRKPDLYLYKLFSILWDVLLAWGCLRLVRSLTGERRENAAPLIAFAAALLLPTVVVNGAYWGQCDAIYGALCIHAAALLMEGNNKTSVALMGVAFSFKLQAIFVLPLWGVLWLAGKVKFRELWVFPLTYLVTVLPAMFLGKPLMEILGIYINQMGEYPRLVLNAPSVYQFLPEGGAEVNQRPASLLGIAAAGILVLLMLALGLRLRDRLDRELAMTIAVVLAIGVPFFLPHMHERYFFLADVFTLCWACANFRRVPAVVLACGSSLASYFVYLRNAKNFTCTIGGNLYLMPLEALAMLAALAFALCVLGTQLRNGRNRPILI